MLIKLSLTSRDSYHAFVSAFQDKAHSSLENETEIRGKLSLVFDSFVPIERIRWALSSKHGREGSYEYILENSNWAPKAHKPVRINRNSVGELFYHSTDYNSAFLVDLRWVAKPSCISPTHCRSERTPLTPMDGRARIQHAISSDEKSMMVRLSVPNDKSIQATNHQHPSCVLSELTELTWR